MWAEIRNDYYDDIKKKVTIDAWKTSDDDEEGEVIAEINVVTKEVTYRDDRARTDPYAQERIAEVLHDIEDGMYDDAMDVS